jgi:eukaryotic-like serine/threonine-protein kinase
LWMRTYPDKRPEPYNVLALSYRVTGQYEKCIQTINQAMRIPPTFEAEHLNLGVSLTKLNRFEEAKAAYDRALAQGFDTANIRGELYALAFQNGDARAMQQQLDAVRGRPTEHTGLQWQAETAAFAGQWRRGQEMFQDAADSAIQNHAEETAARYVARESLWNATFGKCELTKRTATRSLALARDRTSLADLGLAFAFCGELKNAQSLINELKQRYPKNSFTNERDLVVIKAATELAGNNPALALQGLANSRKYLVSAGFWPQYLRGQVHLKLRQAPEAAVEFQEILDHRGLDPQSALYPLAYLGLARAASLAGDRVKSRDAYERFFAIWKDADSDLPVLIDAKQEYEKQLR